jgi:hypothetical protein
LSGRRRCPTMARPAAFSATASRGRGD